MHPAFVHLTAATVLIIALVAAAGAQTANAPEQVESASAGTLEVEQLATLEYPWGMALLPDGSILVTEKPGRLRIWKDGELSEPVEGVPEVVYRDTEVEQGGLLDVAVDPDFRRNRYIYLSYTEAAAQQPKTLAETGDVRFGGGLDLSDDIVRGGAVARARLEGNRLQDVKVIWRQVPKTVGRGHFGNRLLFGPDGKLFITSGDRMQFEPAQNLSSNLGKVVRINPDGSIPGDNPFVDRDNARGDVWSYGHRNALAAAVDPSGRVWTMEMGPLGGDELNLIEPGRNYGWPRASNGDNYGGPSIPDHATREQFQEPVRSWTPVISPSGAVFYEGDLIPEWRNSLLVGGLSSQALVRLELDGKRVAVEERLDMQQRIRDVVEAPDGAILVLVDAEKGGLLRLAPG